MINITNIGIRQMLLASALVMAATGEASAQSASPEQPPSEATHFAQVDSSKLSTALNGKTLIPTIEIGYKASTANPAIINGHPAMFPVKTLIYPDGRENFRIEYGILHADANQHQSFKSGMRFQVTKVIIKDDCLELEIPMFTEGAILDKSLRGDVKFMFGKGWQSSMTTESVLQTVMGYLPDTETIAKAKAEAERVRAEEAEKARIAAEQPPSEANQAKAPVGGTGTDAGSLEAGIAAEKRGDWKVAYLLLRPLAEQGNPDAQFHLGLMYDYGKGNPDVPYHSGNVYEGGPRLDSTVASIWYRKAAEQGNAQAQNNLGITLKKAIGPNPEFYAQAMEWFHKAADQGNSDAQYNLGIMYYEGKGGVHQDHAQAMKWYRKAAAQGNADAQKHLALISQSGGADIGGTGTDRYANVTVQTYCAQNGICSGPSYDVYTMEISGVRLWMTPDEAKAGLIAKLGDHAQIQMKYAASRLNSSHYVGEMTVSDGDFYIKVSFIEIAPGDAPNPVEADGVYLSFQDNVNVTQADLDELKKSATAKYGNSTFGGGRTATWCHAEGWDGCDDGPTLIFSEDPSIRGDVQGLTLVDGYNPLRDSMSKYLQTINNLKNKPPL